MLTPPLPVRPGNARERNWARALLPAVAAAVMFGAAFAVGAATKSSPSIQAILKSVGGSPQDQLSAIANRDWASTHYYGGSSLRGTFDELSGMTVQTGA